MNCWNCKYQSLDNIELLGKCDFFKKLKKSPPPIPPHIVDKGCKHFNKKEQHPLREEIVKTFRK